MNLNTPKNYKLQQTKQTKSFFLTAIEQKNQEKQTDMYNLSRRLQAAESE